MNRIHGLADVCSGGLPEVYVITFQIVARPHESFVNKIKPG
ncbi:hypothetical protein [Nitrosomonas sp. PY1]|nr:hypothetical protein [Nitrosomonas sp. PY1]